MNTPTVARPTLLIVDDTPANIELILDVLDQDYDLRLATSGPDALALLATGLRPDLILLDAMMPDLDGFQVCAALKGEVATRDIPVIFVTALIDPDSEARALAAGAVDFIHKPISAPVLRARVRLHLELMAYRHHLEARVHERTRELAEARDLAESALRAKCAFLANMGHELRTPMNHIMGFTHMFKRRGEVPAKLIDKVQQSAQGLLALINDMLDYARSEADEIRIVAIDFEPSALLARVEQGVREAAAARGLEFGHELDPRLPACLKGDPARLDKILGILLGNAVKFSERGRITLRVRQTGFCRNAVSLRFEVEDQGIGMPEAIRAGLFQSFRQGDASTTRRHGGAGLGLALAKRLVGLMGGEIGVDSWPGRGSRFWFSLRLPLGDRAEPEPMGGVDWCSLAETVDYLDCLLADGDWQARVLWSQAAERLRPVLGDRTEAMVEALAAFDFDAAQRLLRQAVAACPGLAAHA